MPICESTTIRQYYVCKKRHSNICAFPESPLVFTNKWCYRMFCGYENDKIRSGINIYL